MVSEEVGNTYVKCTFQDMLNNISSLTNKQLIQLINLGIEQVQKNSFTWMYSKGCDYVVKTDDSDYKMSTSVIDDFLEAMDSDNK